jgi:hypothetical protein
MSLGSDFLGNVILLFVAALVTGFALPLILKQVEERKARAQKRFEADLARQSRVIDAQVQLLENLSQLLWGFQLLAIEVSYYYAAKQDGLYERALHKYDENAGDLLGKIRAEVSKSLRLTSVPTYEALKDLYYRGLLDLDMRLRQLIEGHDHDWSKFNHYAVYEFSDRVDNVLNNLAEELRLNGAAVRAPEQQISGVSGV